MAGGQAPGANSRGRGGKFRKFTRGGGKHFSRDLRPLDAEGNEVSMWSEDAQKKLGEGSDEDDDSEEEEDEDESESDEDDPAGRGEGSSRAAAAASAASREDRKKEKKARKEAAIARAKGQAVQVGDLPSSDEEESDEEDLPANPNHSRAGRNQTKLVPPKDDDDVEAATEGVKDLSVGSATAPASRRERESLEALQAKERYRKLHEQGKTDEAKADLARLKVIREKREAEAARKQAEKEEREALEKARKEEIEAREAKKREAALGKPKKGKK